MPLLPQILGRIARAASACLILLAFTAAPTQAADNQLTPEEQKEGWLLLFDGSTTAHWKNDNGKPLPASVVQGGAINPSNCGGYLLIHDRQFSDFVLKCDVKTSKPPCNSGIFFRTSDLADPINNSIEMQVYNGKQPPRHEFGAIYDLVAPSKKATKGPDEWNAVEIRCDGPRVSIKINGELIAEMNCDDYDRPGLRPDGSKHKFRKAIKDLPRKGYFGLQDYHRDVWFRNIKVLELHGSEKHATSAGRVNVARE